MHAHRIDVLDEADGDLVAFRVTDDFELKLFPAERALFDQHLVDQRGSQPAGDHFAQLLDVVDDAAAGAAHRVGRAQDHRIAELVRDLFGLFDRVARLGLRHRDAELVHGLLEDDAVLAALDRIEVDADDLNIVFIENAVVLQRNREVQRGLPAEIRQQRVRTLLRDDLLDAVDGQRFDVGVIRHAGIGHDRGRVRVGQHHLVAEPAQRLARLGSGVIEFARLPDDDRPRADDQHLLDVFPLCHNFLLL